MARLAAEVNVSLGVVATAFDSAVDSGTPGPDGDEPSAVRWWGPNRSALCRDGHSDPRSAAGNRHPWSSDSSSECLYPDLVMVNCHLWGYGADGALWQRGIAHR